MVHVNFQIGEISKLDPSSLWGSGRDKTRLVSSSIVSAPKEQISTSQNGGMPDEFNGVLDR